MSDYTGTPIEMHQAWDVLQRWTSHRQEIGVIFWGRTANVYTLGLIEAASDGRSQLTGSVLGRHSTCGCDLQRRANADVVPLAIPARDGRCPSTRGLCSEGKGIRQSGAGAGSEPGRKPIPHE